jgi:AraC-like DNA-binding protein
MGPFLYFYIRGCLHQNKRIGIKDWFHFAPSVLSFLGIIPYLVSDYSYKLTVSALILNDPSSLLYLDNNIFFSPKFNIFSRPALFLIYIIYCLYYLIQFKASASKNNVFSNHLKIPFTWLFTFLIILLLTISFYFKLCIDFICNLSIQDYIFNKWYYNITGVLISIVALVLTFFPNILYGLPIFNEIATKNNNKRLNKMRYSEIDIPLEQVNNELNGVDNSFVELSTLIQTHLLINKPYLNHNFTVSSLAVQLNIRELHILYCYNSVFKVRFTKMKNQLRVEYAKELLSNGYTINSTIEAIGQESGFSTRSNFYNTFKTETGYTPSEYLKQLKVSHDLS